jgi:hypothetical protein
MIPNQGRWSAVIGCALLCAWGCDDSKQQLPPGPVLGPTAGASAGGSAATAGAPGPRGGSGATSAAGAAGTANAGGRGGAGAGMDAGVSNPAGDDAGINDDGSDAGSDDVGPDVGPVEAWAGMTSQGLEISFDVAEAGLTQLRLQYAFPPVCDGDNTTEFDPPAPLADPFSVEFVLAGATDVTFSGTFASDGRASGTLAFMSTLEPGQPACGIGVLTWNATRQ